MSNWDKYGAWKKEMMEQAMMAYRNWNTGLNAASRTCNVAKATLKQRVDCGILNAVDRVQVFRTFTDLPKETEDELSKQALLLEERFFRFTVHGTGQLAFRAAGANKVPHLFKGEKEMADDKWYYGFICAILKCLCVKGKGRRFQQERVKAVFKF
jgi:hypothetical protein